MSLDGSQVIHGTCVITKNCFQLGTWYVRCIKNKYMVVMNEIISKELDILVVTESWQEFSLGVAVCKCHQAKPSPNCVSRHKK